MTPEAAPAVPATQSPWSDDGSFLTVKDFTRLRFPTILTCQPTRNSFLKVFEYS